MIKKNKSLDGLRGIASLCVALCHFIGAFIPTMLSTNHPEAFPINTNPSAAFKIFTSPIISIFYNGDLAVVIFFALSGYVLTIPYFKGSAEQLLKLRLFGRYLRLNLAIFASILLSYIIYKLNFYYNIQASEILGSTQWLGVFFPSGIKLSTAVELATYKSILYGESTLNPVLWTLKIEFIGSLYLLCFYLAKPEQRNFLALMLVSLFLYGIHSTLSIYYISIFLGASLNLISFEKKYNIMLFILGFYLGAFQCNNILYDFLPSIKILDITIWHKSIFYQTAGALFLIASIINGFLNSFLENKFCQFLGKISFSLYLLHFLIICSFSCAIYMYLPKTNMYLLLNFVSYIMICFLMSTIFAKYIDKTAINIAHKFSKYLFKNTN